MRYLTALFDAPIPARAALAMLMDAGFEARDLQLMPELSQSGLTEHLVEPSDDPRRLRRRLAELGLSSDRVDFLQEGLQRGAILLLAQTPTLAAAGALRLIENAGPLRPEQASLAWRRDPALRYAWSQSPTPQLVEASEANASPNETMLELDQAAEDETGPLPTLEPAEEPSSEATPLPVVDPDMAPLRDNHPSTEAPMDDAEAEDGPALLGGA